MAYLTTEDMYTHIYQENIETISHGDEAIMLSAIDAAIEEASGYLTKYDTQAIFSATGSARNAILLLFVKRYRGMALRQPLQRRSGYGTA